LATADTKLSIQMLDSIQILEVKLDSLLRDRQVPSDLFGTQALGQALQDMSSRIVNESYGDFWCTA